MKKFNLLGSPEKLYRDTKLRKENKLQNQLDALKFGFEYFDGTRAQGYGGYAYDGRWVPVAQKLIDRFALNEDSKFLDVGCAKGFLLHDLTVECPGITVQGIDVSKYAKKNAWGNTEPHICISSCVSLPFPDNSFDASVAINTIHNVNYDECMSSIRELIRVTKNKENIFIQVDAYSNEHERELFEEWLLTAQTYMKPQGWLKMFREVGFQGDYFWTILGFQDK